MSATQPTPRQKCSSLLMLLAPCLIGGLLTFVFLALFSGHLPNRVTSYLIAQNAHLLYSSLFWAICLPGICEQFENVKGAARRADWIWLAMYLGTSLLLLPAVTRLELASSRNYSPGSFGFWLGLGLLTTSFLLLNLALLHKMHGGQALTLPNGRTFLFATTGPYRVLRHPDYLALVIGNLAAPLLLGSLLALVPGLLGALLLSYRAGQKDDYLATHLAQYREYQQHVPWRLLPGLLPASKHRSSESSS